MHAFSLSFYASSESHNKTNNSSYLRAGAAAFRPGTLDKGSRRLRADAFAFVPQDETQAKASLNSSAEPYQFTPKPTVDDANSSLGTADESWSPGQNRPATVYYDQIYSNKSSALANKTRLPSSSNRPRRI